MALGSNKGLTALILLIIVLVLIISGMALFYEEPIVKVSETRDMMDTYVTVTVYAKEDEGNEAIGVAFDRMDEVVAVANRYNTSSEVSILNSQGYIDNPSPELVEMIELSIEYWNITDGSFDITILPLLDLWSFKVGTDAYLMFNIGHSFTDELNSGNLTQDLRTHFSDNGYPLEDTASINVGTPDEQYSVYSSWHEYYVINGSQNFGVYTQFWNLLEWEQDQYINDTKAFVGSDMITVTENRISLQPGMTITLDGMAKGYIVDKGLEALEGEGIKHALIDAGGDIATLDSKADDKKWVIGLRNPENRDESVTEFKLADKAIATSGNYERWFNLSAGVGHIMDPQTGRSVLYCSSATVIADTCAEADILATAIFVQGPDDGIDLVNSLPCVEAFVLGYTDPKNQTYRSSDLDEFEITD